MLWKSSSVWPCCYFFTQEKDEQALEDEDEEQLNREQELEDRLLQEFPQEEQEGEEEEEEEEFEASAEDRIGTEISERFDRDDSNLNVMVVNIVWDLSKWTYQWKCFETRCM